MRAARWVVVGTALLAAAVAFYLLMGPGPAKSPGQASRPVTIPKGPASHGAPQEEIDPESRDAMRDFLRQSLGGEATGGAGGRDERERPAAR